MEVRATHPLRIGDRGGRAGVRPVAAEPHRQQPDLAVTELEHMLGELAHRCPVVDAHPGHPGHVAGLVDHHHRQVPLQDRRQVGVVIGGRVDDETVDTGGQHRGRAVGDTAVGPDRHQQQSLAHRFARLGQPGDEVERGRIPERVVQRLGDDQPHRAGLAGTQRARHRVRTGVAERLRGRQHALAQLGRQLVGPVVGVRDGGPRDLQLSGE